MNMVEFSVPQNQGLYDKRNEKDSCGVGFVVHIKGKKSHEIVQDIDTKEAALIHAYLHRKEGDDWNADYWYHRAGTKRTNHSIEEEWDSLVARFIS